ncbi:DUF6306 domain-containing protein [Enhydrobacter sp.]|jgi:hypothetical protein|uniref:DUF6306 domain-containing protein n=1 Tax=Enhydrobacter sp. TaxID=1894999 RepID=UPI0026369C37|nr:DUF6306 domain-containing protein [Enhydrobacter sp.]WIM12535.1 MAG: hypothetical protein OJF58_003497 [Enhydrobacter sp.]
MIAAPIAGQPEVIDFLNELLEAERAGARVALDTAWEAAEPAMAEIMQGIRRDEARWCAMLLRQIERIGGKPSPRTGPLHDEAMAIEDLRARVVFLNRGQGRVVRKLREMMPRLEDQALYADLAHMLSSHVANITIANSALG